ncbi:MAG: phosphatidylserine decarboxylase family protein, partial [Acidobacteria bacterium]|nr:phosphatidylserine decarboxylase family protein [Acidobacteriota bacterium]NIM64240.1 phosphatidylserine decarboxylase family protein [Acidobacteriota bacterium]NIO59238.1 phosphatidylserine decarboxylase family protein [Acidobacteriota bacterium]NIQ30265.1 phosphatidylserine decarboxylase family protein [Acidobacteriota bacterium]NIQ85193.1 phosphatidylserine decarboxylase family protein [Acidobacteriota bacterium]
MKVSPHAWPFAASALVAALVPGAWVHWSAALPAIVFLLFTLWFFRDPERDVPQDAGLLVSPADGTIIGARPDRISIFMNVFNVHVCRAPAAGKVRSVVHHPGRFLAAWRDEAPEQNERVVVDLDVEDGSLRFTL